MQTVLLHPQLIHFPIVLILVGFAADLASLVFPKIPCLSKTGFYLEILGLIGVFFAFGSGYFFTTEMEGAAGLARERHELFALITMITMTIATAFRIFIVVKNVEEGNFRYVSLFLFFLATVFVSYTGFLGGGLVWDYLIGI